MKVFLELGRYDAVLFDMDGVVTDTAPVHEAAWKRTFDQFLSTLSALFLGFTLLGVAISFRGCDACVARFLGKSL